MVLLVLREDIIIDAFTDPKGEVQNLFLVQLNAVFLLYVIQLFEVVYLVVVARILWLVV